MKLEKLSFEEKESLENVAVVVAVVVVAVVDDDGETLSARYVKRGFVIDVLKSKTKFKHEFSEKVEPFTEKNFSPNDLAFWN
jgi:hypothetical protein